MTNKNMKYTIKEGYIKKGGKNEYDPNKNKRPSEPPKGMGKLNIIR